MNSYARVIARVNCMMRVGGRHVMLLAAASLAFCVVPARAQGAPPSVPLPTIRPRTNLQVVGGGMQVPWTVSIRPATNYVAIGQCLPVYIDLLDATGKDIPRNLKGQRVTIADFDWTASGNAAVGKYDGPNWWAVCACPAAAVGSTVHVMATYPAASLPEAARVPGLAFQSYIELPITPAHGTNSPPGCDNVIVTTTVATSVPGGSAPPTTGAHTGVPVVGGPVAVAPSTGRDPSQAQIVPANPKRFSAMQTGNGAVTLQWEAVPGVAWYQVWGAGLPNTGVTVSSGTMTTVTNVPSGMQTWSVGSFYSPGPVSTAAGDFTKTQLQVTNVAAGPTPPSGNASPPGGTPGTSAPTTTTTAPVAARGRYRVTATGFRVLHQTKDDVLSRDGHGDEIYGGFMTYWYDRTTSKLIGSPVVSRTQVIGENGFDGQTAGVFTDVNGVVPHGRIRGGTASAGGGFQQNDVFPAVADPSQTYGVAATNNTFPFALLDNWLTDGKEALVIVPTLWEADGYRDGFAKWYGSESANAIQIWSDQSVQAAVAGNNLAVISPAGTLETSFGPHMDAGQTAFGLIFGPSFTAFALLNSGSYDRPIGIGMNGLPGLGGIPVGAVLPRRAIVITREIIEATLNRLATYNPATVAPAVFQVPGAPPVTLPVPPPGTLAVQLLESPADDLQGMYILYLKVERAP